MHIVGKRGTILNEMFNIIASLNPERFVDHMN